MISRRFALWLAFGPAGEGQAPVEDGLAPDWAEAIQSWEEEPSGRREPAEDAPPAEPTEQAEDASDELEPAFSAPDRQSLTGSLRLVGGYLRFPDQRAFPGDRNDTFIAAEGRVLAAREFSDNADVEVNAYVDVTRSPGSVLGGTFATAGSFTTPYRSQVMALSIQGDGPVQVRFGLDRARVGIHGNRVAFDLGRFPVNYAVAQIFTPNDFFAPFSATAINRIFKPGVDAARLGVALGKLSSFEFVSVMGWTGTLSPSWSKTALVARPSIVLWNFEWAVLGGKVAERWLVGASFQGDAGPIGLRGEGHVGFPDRDGDGLDDEDVHVRLSAGPNVNFAWHNATIAAEYAFFSDGENTPSAYAARFARRFPDDLPYLGRHYVGVVAGIDVVPILRLNTTAVVNAGDGSGLAGLFVAYSIADESDLLVGAFVPWGRRPAADLAVPVLESEFGVQPITAFFETRIFF